ncbi:MAG: 50S ribosomal protein L28 [Proteobacteria bacterium]|nr:50S ribosomal protein L28 [Pseudomonadota bacterium]
MAHGCALCGKTRQAAHKVSHSNIKTRKWQRPNLQRVRALVDGRATHIVVCTRCIRSGRVTKAA